MGRFPTIQSLAAPGCSYERIRVNDMRAAGCYVIGAIIVVILLAVVAGLSR
jgi:hypothetical protein